MSIDDKFNIVTRPDFKGNLREEELEQVLRMLPFDFEFVPEDWNSKLIYMGDRKGKMEVYCYNTVIMLYPQKGKRIYRAKCTDSHFPLCPETSLADNFSSVSDSFRPKLSAFGVDRGKGYDSIEIKIHKYPKEEEVVFF